MNNVDVIILILVGLSSLIALSRGLIKEVLSIIGWVLATISIIYLLPVFEPIVDEYIISGWMASVVGAIIILIVFMLIWYFATNGLIKDIRKSRLSTADRVLGLFFGIARAFLLVILFYIMIGWIMPPKTQPEVLQDSKYFQLAGTFAKPIEDLIPEETLVEIRERAKNWTEQDKPKKENKKEKTSDKPGDEAAELFEKLARPQIKKVIEEAKKEQENENKDDGYNNNERENLDRLIENTIE
ncbi:MAG: CvpA family protein [Alphaproteobacteria bacterium]|nr:CvpA family protein [Alphaproteobacteria bacterium]